MSITGINADFAEANIPSRIILAIDTSSPEASLAVYSSEKIIATLTIREDRPHSQTLFKHIASLLRLTGITIEDVGAFATASGPGSFTGLRVGIATVKGMAEGLNRPCLGVDSLELLALASGFTGVHLIIIGAGRDEIYCGFRQCSSGDILGVSIADQVGEPSSVLHSMKQYLRPSPLIITLDGRYAYREEVFDRIREMQVELEGSGSKSILIIPSLNIAAVLAERAALLIEKNRILPVKPHYIRKSDADIKWKP